MPQMKSIAVSIHEGRQSISKKRGEVPICRPRFRFLTFAGKLFVSDRPHC